MILQFRKRYIPAAATSEAKLPTKKSSGKAPAKLILNSKQPTVRPGMAAGVNSASTHSASDALNWMAQVAEPGRSRFCRWVRAKYMAPMMAAWVMFFVLFIEMLLLDRPSPQEAIIQCFRNKKWAQSTHPNFLVLFTDRMVSNCPM